jgi:hypothetical protein
MQELQFSPPPLFTTNIKLKLLVDGTRWCFTFILCILGVVSKLNIAVTQLHMLYTGLAQEMQQV